MFKLCDPLSEFKKSATSSLTYSLWKQHYLHTKSLLQMSKTA